ncbi:hypothetical protein ACFQZE_08265 [Paenibacillus sp. GCM10027627]|uniref:BC1872 family protein n=1 Tax=unclassified Paenibacillus TaxID=185978 RepID=UPI00363072BD
MLTRDMLNTMKPGKELNGLVATHVMEITEVDWLYDYPWFKDTDGTYRAVNEYSKDISAAWEVVEKIDEGKRGISVSKSPYYDDVWIVEISIFEADEEGKIHIVDKFIAEAKSAPEAICKAALLAVLRL